MRKVQPEHHNAPVPSRYGSNARLLIVGLAPGARGANRTGRAFHGDASSRALFAGLAAAGFARSADSAVLPTGVALTNAVRCLPPVNRPTAVEVSRCRPFLEREIAQWTRPTLVKPRVVLALGRVAFEVLAEIAQLPAATFSHGAEFDLPGRATLLASYHTSLQNMNTRRLTPEMFEQVLHRARQIIDGA
ncbi:MAG: hypothetical protein NXH85_13600 [Pseudomonadaceae bacterium]|nr:hypothetical protein [Pseudomonadaceae bacterium]